MATPTILPITTIQPDFLNVISDVQAGVVPSETIWISCYKTDRPSVHGKVDATLDDSDRDLVVFERREGDVKLERNGPSYTISCPLLEIHPTKILVPSREFADPDHTNPQRPPRRITAFDISPDGTQFATGYQDGAVRLTTISMSRSQKFPKPHLSMLTSLSFFPSSRVLLTAGADFTLTILPADPAAAEPSSLAPNPARILKGHSRAITSTAIISRGRNVLSAAKDGTLRLWDSSSGTQIRMMGTGKGKYTPINAMLVGDRANIDTGATVTVDGSVPRDEREVDTAEKLVFCALQDGSFEVFDLGSKLSIFQSQPTHAGGLTAIAYTSSQSLLATGSSQGLITVYSTATSLSSSPLCSFARNGASIEALAFNSAGLVVATDDGLPFIVSVGTGSPMVESELVGGDCDGVRVVRTQERRIWTAGDDGVVRVYNL